VLISQKNVLLLLTLKNKAIMKISRLIPGFLVILLLQSCASMKLTSESNTAFEQGDYEKVLVNLNQVIEAKEASGKKAKGEVYEKAGIAAYNLKNIEKAQKYLETAKGIAYSSEPMYATLAKVYKHIDNLSKEITALEIYSKNYPQGTEIKKIRIRLIETYVESENWDYAVELWPQLETQAQTDVNVLANYLIVNKNLKNNDVCNSLAKQIKKLDANNIILLEYYAEKYFWQAENLYVSEMKAYKKKRTTKQYNKLLKALEKVWPSFKKSRSNYLKLYKIDPKPEYAGYLAKIYTRFDDKQKAAYYKKRAK